MVTCCMVLFELNIITFPQACVVIVQMEGFEEKKNGKLKIIIHYFDYVVQKATDG